MDLAKLEFPLRPRGHWEAIDLGFALARRWFRPLLLLWLVTALPVSVMLFLLIGDNLIWLSLAIWWCKPLYEPLMVFWLSRAVFGEQLPVRAVARGWWRINRSALLANITLRRLGPSRSFFMPVALLEGLKGKERSKRIHVLGRNQTAGTWLTIIGVHFEAILQLSLIIGLMILLPDELRWIETNDLFFSPNFVEQLLWLISWMVGMAIIAPFYVAGGFSLYLHRRSELEGWDIEINFRRTVEKLNPQRRQRNLGSVALLLLVIGLISFPPPPVMAGEPGPPQSKALIEQVLAEPRFGLMEQQGYWKYVGEKEEEEEVDPGFLENLVDVLKVFIDIFRGFFQGTASLGEILLWCVGLLIVAFLLYHLTRNARWMQNLIGNRSERRREIPTHLFGLDVRAESLPDDIAAEALQRLRRGELRQALSLLYRGSLIRLIHDHQLDIPGSATEGECLRLVQTQRSADEIGFFSRLTELWLVTAYAHITPQTQQIERLCHDWREVYGDGHQ